MNDDDYDNPAQGYSKPVHSQSGNYPSWGPTSGQQLKSNISGQDFYLDNGVKNVEKIQTITLDAHYRDICPVWKPALPGTTSIFDNS